MPAWLRSILAVAGGLAAAIVVVFIVDILNSLIFPPPPGIDMNDQEAMRAFAERLPVGAFVILITGWGVASFVGSWIAGRIGRHAPFVHSMVFTGLFLMVGISNLILIPHPIWVWVIGIAAYVGSGFAGARLATRRGTLAAA
jgi:hypothetical protein